MVSLAFNTSDHDKQKTPKAQNPHICHRFLQKHVAVSVYMYKGTDTESTASVPMKGWPAASSVFCSIGLRDAKNTIWVYPMYPSPTMSGESGMPAHFKIILYSLLFCLQLITGFRSNSSCWANGSFWQWDLALTSAPRHSSAPIPYK